MKVLIDLKVNLSRSGLKDDMRKLINIRYFQRTADASDTSHNSGKYENPAHVLFYCPREKKYSIQYFGFKDKSEEHNGRDI